MKRMIQKLATATVSMALLVGATACVPDKPVQIFPEPLKTIEKTAPPTSAARPTQSKPTAQSNGVEIKEILPEPPCAWGIGNCNANEVWKGVVANAPQYRLGGVENRGNRKAMFVSTALTLIGPGTGTNNSRTNAENIVNMINGATHDSQFACFHFEMRNWVTVNSTNQTYMKTASEAFKLGLPKMGALVIAGKAQPSSISRANYGSDKGEGFNVDNVKKVSEVMLDIAEIEMPSATVAIDRWAKAYAKSAELGAEIMYERSLTDLSARMMYCGM